MVLCWGYELVLPYFLYTYLPAAAIDRENPNLRRWVQVTPYGIPINRERWDSRQHAYYYNLSSGEEEIFGGFSEDLVFICVGEEIESVPD